MTAAVTLKMELLPRSGVRRVRLLGSLVSRRGGTALAAAPGAMNGRGADCSVFRRQDRAGGRDARDGVVEGGGEFGRRGRGGGSGSWWRGRRGPSVACGPVGWSRVRSGGGPCRGCALAPPPDHQEVDPLDTTTRALTPWPCLPPAPRPGRDDPAPRGDHHQHQGREGMPRVGDFATSTTRRAGAPDRMCGRPRGIRTVWAGGRRGRGSRGCRR